MRRHKHMAILTLLVFTISLTGCATDGHYDPARSGAVGALGGAATGAALGSIIGAATGSPGTGAWVGAATGAVAGGVAGILYAAHMNRRTQESAMAAQTYNYTPTQGNFVDIGEVSAQPGALRPGQEVLLGMTYTILTPDNAPQMVTITREVRKDGMIMGQPYQTQASNINGTYHDQVTFRLPGNAAPGVYTVTSRISSGAGSAEKFTSFTIM
ncbi:MAG: hypothetical protein FJ128_04735 [Deltaproteobacteria bacterium]|nr:hypothetical protein [Deltaproteobacteria bacterium]